VRAVLLAVPTVTIAFALAGPPAQELLWTLRGQSHWGPLSSVVVDAAPWFWVNAAFASGCLLAALAMLGWHYASLWPRYGQEAVCVMLAIAGPWTSNLLGLAFGIRETVDLDALGLIGSSVLIALALRPDPLESLLARAQQTLLDALGDAILLVDSQCQVIYANRRALALLRRTSRGSPAAHSCASGRSSPPRCWPAARAAAR
jgi:hypothetical protein